MDLAALSYREPGYEGARFFLDPQGRLHFAREVADATGVRDTTGIGTIASLDGVRLSDAAFWCVQQLKAHEAGEWFYMEGERPYDPHTTEWWWKSYMRGPQGGMPWAAG